MCCIVALLVQLIPNAIFWFTGEAVSDDDYEEGEDEDEEEEDEDEDEEDDDDEVRRVGVQLGVQHIWRFRFAHSPFLG